MNAVSQVNGETRAFLDSHSKKSKIAFPRVLTNLKIILE